MDDEVQEWQRSFLGFSERFLQDYRMPLSNGKTVRISQAPKLANMEQDDRSHDPGITGSTVWDAGIVLAQYLTHHTPDSHALFKSPPSVVLELGSGTGIVSLAVASTWKIRNVVLTDIASMAPLLKKNIALNKSLFCPGVQMHVHSLRWGVEEDVQSIPLLANKCDLVYGSDLIYSDVIDQDVLLLSTLHRVCSSSTVVFIAMHRLHQPERVDEFLRKLEIHFENVRVIPLEEQPAAWRTCEVVLVRAVGIHAVPLERPAPSEPKEGAES